MVSVLLTIGGLALIGIFVGVSNSQTTFGSQLEEYIVSRHPQDVADIERFARDYQLSANKRYLWTKLKNYYIVSLKPFRISKNTKRVKCHEMYWRPNDAIQMG